MSFTKDKKNKNNHKLDELALAESLWGPLSEPSSTSLRFLVSSHHLSVRLGHLLFLNQTWYVTHSGLLNLAKRRRCFGIRVTPAPEFCDIANNRFAFQATVYRHRECKGFTGYGDADPSNVSPVVHGAEMRVAETRAVNRALRKAYGIGICSVEEIGSVVPVQRPETESKTRKVPLPSANDNGNNGRGSNGNAHGIRVRDRLCQVIRQHGLDAELVKAYAIDFCGTKTLREASREQVEGFVAHLADWAAKDRNALLCQLNSYSRPQAGAA